MLAAEIGDAVGAVACANNAEPSSMPPFDMISRALDHVLQLADVARPVVGARALDEASARRRRSSCRACAPPWPQSAATSRGMSSRRSRSGGSVDRKDVEPVVEVVAEAARRPRALQVAVGRGDHAHVDAQTASCRRRARTRRSCSTRSSFAWASSGSSPTSSRNSVPPSASSKRPRRCCVRAGEGALLVAEELALDQLARHRGAVDLDQRPLARAGWPRGSRARPAPCRCRFRPGSAPCCRSGRPARSARAGAARRRIADDRIARSSTSRRRVAFDLRCASISRRNAMCVPTRASSSSGSNGLVT